MLSLGIGFLGSRVVLSPSGDSEEGVILVFGAGLFFGLYLIATRQVSQHRDAIKTLAFQCVAGTVLLTPQAAFTFQVPLAPLVYLELVGSVIFGFLIFQVVPTLMTIVGAGLIIFAGLLLVIRNNLSARPG
ncbi:MAG: hypothetical protein AB8C46_06890 [Burkholderiaceae bacterium]